MRSVMYLLLTVLSAACGLGGPSNGPGREGDPLPQIEQVLYSSGIKGELHYVRNGMSAVILIPGPGYDRRMFYLETAAAYKNAGRAVLILDMLPGGNPDGVSIASLSADLHKIAQDLRQRFPVFVFHGVSTGGAIAVRTQADYGDAAGIIIQSVTPQSHPSGIRQTDQEAMNAAPMVKIPAGVRALFINPAASSADLQMQDLLLSVPMPRGLAQDMLHLYDDPSELHAGQITGKALVQYGGEDKALAPPGMWAAGVQVKTYPQLGHVFEMHRSDLRREQIADMINAAQIFAPIVR